MRPVRDSPRSPRSSRIRTLVLIGVGILLLLFLSASGLAQLYTDWLWFDSLGLTSVWSTVLGTQLVLGIGFATIFALLLWVNLFVADRLAPPERPESPEEDLIQRYHELVGGYGSRLRIGVSVLFGLFAGAQTSGEWRTWLLFRNGGDFGRLDPLFDRDAGFYVFRLPFWTFLVDFFFSALVFALVISLIAHYLNGGIRAAAAPNERATSGVKVHLSVLLAVLALIRALAYWLDRYHLVNSQRGLYDGALTTDVEVQLPALNLLTLVSVFGALLFIWNIRRAGWVLPVVAVGLWAVSHVVVATMFPALFQRLRVEPEQSERERDYIGFNIDATRFAYGLDDGGLSSIVFPYEPTITSEQVEANADIFDDVSILDPNLAAEDYNRSEAGRQAYKFDDTLDEGQYRFEDGLRPVTIGARSLDLTSVGSSWEDQHIVNTHGFGVAVASANTSDGRGLPDYAVRGIGRGQVISEELQIDLDQPRIYYDEDFGGYAIVGATRDERDIEAADSVDFRYDGEGGVRMSGLLRRLAFSLRFQQLDPMISPFIQNGTRVIYNRDIEDRVRELAPFLEFDSDPYPIIAEGQIYWIIDAYTTTSNFPYAQSVDVASLGIRSDLARGYNYVRNSVKVVIDAYDGDASFYIVDDEDPMIEAWAGAFPDLFSPVAEAPASIREHFRYPTDLFKVQTETWDTYQISDPIRFLEGSLAWRVSSQPRRTGGEDESAASSALMDPQYRTTRLPNKTESDFVIQRSFVPNSSSANTGRPEVEAIMVGVVDDDGTGRLIQYDVQSSDLNAADLVDSEIRRDDTVSPFVTLRNRDGSTVRFGEMQMVLVENTVVYIRPLYIEAQADNPVPELRQIIAVNSNRIAMKDSLDEAVAAVTVDGFDPGEIPTDDGGEPTTTPPATGDLGDLSVAELLSLAESLLDDANRVADTDPELAGQLRAEALDALDRLGEVLGVPDSTGTGEAAGA